MKSKNMILACPNCGGHSVANEENEGEWRHSCDYCDTVSYYNEAEQELKFLGELIMQYGTGNPDSNEYVMFTIQKVDGGIKCFVLSNAEIIHEGMDMKKAAEIYARTMEGIE